MVDLIERIRKSIEEKDYNGVNSLSEYFSTVHDELTAALNETDITDGTYEINYTTRSSANLEFKLHIADSKIKGINYKAHDSATGIKTKMYLGLGRKL